MNLEKIKAGDRDSLGKVIKKIFIKSTRNKKGKTAEKEVKYLIYETNDGMLYYDALNEFAKKMVKYSSQLQFIAALLDIDISLRKKYNLTLANSFRKIFESEDNEELRLFFEELKSNIKKNIFSVARLRYLKRYLSYILIVLSVVLLFWWYNSTISGTYFFNDFDELFINSLYLAAAGAIGGFISITLKINKLEIDPFIPFKRTILDADVRVILAMIFGVLIYWFLQSGFVSFIVTDKLNFNTINGKFLSLSIAVVAGFSERLIPNILSQKESSILAKK